MKTSVVLTVYNGERFLLEMLDSLRKQTRRIDEVLILDDCSTDESAQLVGRYLKKYHLNNWKLRTNPQNLGWEKNFTQGMELAEGDVIFPCDQDDIWHLDKVEKMAEAFENNDDIWLLVSGFHAFSENGGKIEKQQVVHTETADIVSRVAFDEHYYQILRPGCTMAFKRDIMPIFSKLWSSGTPHDALLWVIAAIQRKLYLYNDTFIEFRRHDANATKNISHVYRYKVNEARRTKMANEYFLNVLELPEELKTVLMECSKWCELREKLLVEKKRRCWLQLWKYRHFYLTNKKYIGDLYYSFQKS